MERTLLPTSHPSLETVEKWVQKEGGISCWVANEPTQWSLVPLNRSPASRTVAGCLCWKAGNGKHFSLLQNSSFLSSPFRHAGLSSVPVHFLSLAVRTCSPSPVRSLRSPPSARSPPSFFPPPPRAACARQTTATHYCMLCSPRVHPRFPFAERAEGGGWYVGLAATFVAYCVFIIVFPPPAHSLARPQRAARDIGAGRQRIQL